VEYKPTVCLTFDFDAISIWLGTFKAKSPSMISRGEFGKIGARRILNLLDQFEILSTWFIPGHTADTFSEIVLDIDSHGHEIGHHGYCHENPIGLEEPQERKIMDMGISAIEKITGKRPIGYRSPSWDLSPNTIRILLEYGFVYDSSMMGNDFQPYWCRQGDQFDMESPYRFGNPVDLVEMPVTWGLDDWPAFEYVSLPNKLYPGLRSPDQVFDIWMGDFNYMSNNIPNGVFILTLHPQVIGRGHRMLFFERLLECMKEKEVLFKRMGDYAQEWKEVQMDNK
jgi:peptidoglycan-N-acetylglucosamine deacetylase